MTEAIAFSRLRNDEYSTGKKPPAKGIDLPAVVRPNGDNSLNALKNFVRTNRDEILSKMRSCGAVLFRGFDIQSAQDFEDIALLIEPNLSKEYLGTSPRTAVTEYTFTASELPNFFPIPQHIEMSFLKSQPKKLMFCCLQPSLTGGETPLCDFSRVAQDLDPSLRAKFEKRGIRYYRNYAAPDSSFSIDPWKLKKWPEVFGTKDPKNVEKTCEKDEVHVQWQNNGALRLKNDMPAIVEHNHHGKVWSNHSQVFHPTQATGEFKRISKLTGVWWHYVMYFIALILVFFRRLFQSEESQGMNALFGDGTVISNDEMEKVRDAIWDNMVIYPWRKGDIVIIDNSFTSHGRLPYTGPRRVIVSWG